ncbi:MAG: hypothetical protein R3F59_26430 [Myxococcota bacterium]
MTLLLALTFGTADATTLACSATSSACYWMKATTVWPDPHTTYPHTAVGYRHFGYQQPANGAPYWPGSLTSDVREQAWLESLRTYWFGVYKPTLRALGWLSPLYFCPAPGQVHSMDAAANGTAGTGHVLSASNAGPELYAVGGFFVDTSGYGAGVALVYADDIDGGGEDYLVELTDGSLWDVPGPVLPGETVFGP